MPTKKPTTKKTDKKKTRRPKAPRAVTSSKGRGTTLDKFLTLEKLKPYFQLELGIKRACNYYNTKARDEYFQALAFGRTRLTEPEHIAPSTVQTWYENDEAVRSIIDSWKDTTNIMARQTWRKKISQDDYAASKDWLERREKEYFSVKTEVEHKGDTPQLPGTSIRIEKANILFQLGTSQKDDSSQTTSST